MFGASDLHSHKYELLAPVPLSRKGTIKGRSLSRSPSNASFCRQQTLEQTATTPTTKAPTTPSTQDRFTYEEHQLDDGSFHSDHCSSWSASSCDLDQVHPVPILPKLSIARVKTPPGPDKQLLIDHVTRWEGLPLTGAESGEGEDGPTIVTDTIKEEDETEAEELPYHKRFIKRTVRWLSDKEDMPVSDKDPLTTSTDHQAKAERRVAEDDSNSDTSRTLLSSSIFRTPLEEMDKDKTGSVGMLAPLDTSVFLFQEISNPTKPHPCQYVKMMLPHVILISMLLSYLAGGALILGHLEEQTEVEHRSDRLVKLKRMYDNVIEDTWKLYSYSDRDLSEGDWNATMMWQLKRVSALYEEDLAAVERPPVQHNLSTKWTFPTSLLYVLTVLTTCGYNEVDVSTDQGKIFSVIFALVGIPLMFITAADLGKFLSETLLKFMNQCERCWRHFLWCCCKRRPKDASKSSIPSGEPRDSLDEMVEGDEMEGTSLFFPIGAYFFLISLYCSLGAAMFQHYQHDWSFIHAFHFGFNLIVTVGLGDLVVDDPLYLCLIVAYVIIGLSVVTMCVDLASTHLKAYFTRIHYFGRARRFLGVSEDIREMMELIARMRKKKGGKVTWQDIQQYMDTKHDNRLRPFCPKDFHKWRYVDETSSAVSTMRHNSQSSDLYIDPITGHTIRRHSYMKNNNNTKPCEDDDEEIPFL